MRPTVLFAFVTLVTAISFARLTADADYLTKDGELAESLKIVQLQGGFAGFTGTRWTIAPDGSWTAESLFNQKATPKGKGKLTAEQLKTLGQLLDKNEVGELPKSIGKATGANPHTVTIEWGKTVSTYHGQKPPHFDAMKPTDTPESRVAGTLKGVRALLK